ncbi:uncharacterized protein LOC120748305 [Hirundo rustica]|uniref:uncharacterized protein LOC120748305 n=1 Tax=Hirundo rustica TaxID=43150 RepID=UPI00267327C4|nr:uncharacterized protein LOC120748305 [Hirundo rustica]
MRGAAAPGSNAARGPEPGEREKMASAPPQTPNPNPKPQTPALCPVIPQDSAGFPPVEEVEELSQELLRELSSGCTEELLRRGLECRQRLDQRLLEAQSRARGLARDLSQAEAGLSRRLQRAQAEAQRLQGRRLQLERGAAAGAGGPERRGFFGAPRLP